MEYHGFVFYANSPAFDEQQDFVAHIAASIGDTKTLFDVLFHKMQLPGYFGFNWDALSDCLRDLSWIEQRRVIIVHHDVPHLTTEDLSTYLSVLEQGMESWKPSEDHQLVVAFPKECETAVVNIVDHQES